ncbi:uncharacterized protein LOC144106403 [Amblyomma americanum]
MALTLRNRHLTALTNEQLDQLNAARSRFGQHVFYQDSGESTTKTFMFGMVDELSFEGAGVDIAVRVGKGFYMKMRNVEGFGYYDYRFPKSPGSTEAISWRNFQPSGTPFTMDVTDNVVLPGYHIISIYVDDQLSSMFSVDKKPMFQRVAVRIHRTIIIHIQSDNGAVFEVHQTAPERDMIFNEGQYTYLSPTLTIGAYMEITGTRISSEHWPRVDFGQDPIISEEPLEDLGNEIQVSIRVPPSPDGVFTGYIKYYRSYMMSDGGAGIDVVSHQLYHPKRYHVRHADVLDMTVVTGPELT